MKVLYVGDNEKKTNHFFSGSQSIQVFQGETRDYEPLLNALEGEGIDVDHMTAEAAIELFPDTMEELEEYDALILSDLSRDSLLPHFQPDAWPGPNRVKLIREYVEDGGGLVFCGGWMSFQGYQGVGNWHESRLAPAIPLEIRPVPDDRVDAPEGVEVSVVDDDHPVSAGVDWEEYPTLYGYNRLGGAAEGADLLAEVDGHPLLAAGDHGDGRVVAYASDPGPKWGMAFYEWDGYPGFWRGALEWVTGEN